jgi:hypothetical protein
MQEYCIVLGNQPACMQAQQQRVFVLTWHWVQLLCSMHFAASGNLLP